MKFPLIPLSEIARPVVRPIPVVPGTSYRTIGVKWWGEGAYERETIDGSQTAAKTLSIVHEGDLIINKIWVRHGSIAIASKAVDGCTASGEFPTFELDQARVVPRWIHWLTKTQDFWSKCDSLSRGTSGKNRIKPELFLTIRIPLPCLDEQQRIVARIEELAAKIEEARGLRGQAIEEAEVFTCMILDEFLASSTFRFGSTRLEEVCISIADGDHVTPTFVNKGIKFIFVGNVSSGHFHFDDCKYVMPEYYATIKPQRRPQKGDVLYSAVGATLGVPAIVDCDDDFCFQRHVAIIKPDRARLSSKFLWYMLRSGMMMKNTWAATTGSAQPTVPLKAIRMLSVPIPPIPEQQRIVAHLDGLLSKLDPLKCLQAETSAEMEVLLPSVLDKAFKGEL
jgi:type I restriction enzyme S subunit